MKIIFLLLSIAFINSQTILQKNPTVSLAVSTPLIDQVITDARPLIEERLKQEQLEDIIDSGYIKSIKVTNMHVVDAIIDPDGLELITEKQQLTIEVNNLQLKIEGDAWVRVTVVSGTGKLKINLKDFSLKVVLQTQIDADKRLTAIVDSIDVNPGDLDVSLDGNVGADIIGKFIRFIKSSIMSQIIDTTKEDVRDYAIPILNEKLKKLPYQIQLLNSQLDVVYQPHDNVSFNSDRIGSSIDGYFFNIVNKGDMSSIREPVQMDQSSLPNKHLRFIATDYLFNTFLYSLHQDTELDLEISEEKYKKYLDQIGIKMTTKWWNQYIDGLEQQYGDQQLIIQLTKNDKTPQINSSKQNGTTAQFGLLAKFLIQDSTGQYVHQFSIDITASSAVKLSIVDNTLIANINELRCLEANIISKTSQKSVKDQINQFLDANRDQIEQYVEKGVKIPKVMDIDLVNPDVLIMDEYVIVETDLQPHPMAKRLATLLAQSIVNIANKTLKAATSSLNRFRTTKTRRNIFL